MRRLAASVLFALLGCGDNDPPALHDVISCQCAFYRAMGVQCRWDVDIRSCSRQCTIREVLESEQKVNEEHCP